MQTKIEQINRSIAEKQERLQEKAQRYFAAMEAATASSSTTTSPREGGATTIPVATYALYAGAALSAGATLFSDERKLLYGVLALASTAGGYYLSKQSKTQRGATPTAGPSLSSLKIKTMGEINAAVQKTAQEWEEFITAHQKSLQLHIESLELPAERKDALLTATYQHEIIDLRLSDLHHIVEEAQSVPALQQALKLCQEKLQAAIVATTQRQMENYAALAV